MKSDQQHEIKMFDKMREISTAQKMLDDATKKMKSLSDSQASMESLVNELKANYTVLSQNVEQEVEASREKDIALTETIDLLEEELKKLERRISNAYVPVKSTSEKNEEQEIVDEESAKNEPKVESKPPQEKE